MANLERFRISWEARENEVNQGLKSLYQDVELADVSLFCEGHLLRCHKLVLTLSSTYFNNVFRLGSTDTGNTLVVMHTTALKDLQNLLHFMYTGEVEILDSELVGFLQLSQSLGVTGLTQIFQQVYGNKNVDVNGADASRITIPSSSFPDQNPDNTSSPTILSNPVTIGSFSGATQTTVHLEIDPTADYSVEQTVRSHSQVMDEGSLDDDMNSQSQSSSSTSFSTAPTPLTLLKTEFVDVEDVAPPLDNQQFEVEEVDTINYETPKDKDNEYVPPSTRRVNKPRAARPKTRMRSSDPRPGPSIRSEFSPSGPKVITKCNECHLSIAGRPALHMAQYHNNEDRGVSYLCGFCGQKFRQLLICEAHYKFMHDKMSEKKFKCRKCSMAFNNQTLHRQHLRTHPEYEKRPSNS